MKAPIDQVVILAAGQGTRLRKNQEDYLKPLYPLADKPLVGWVMESFYACGVKEFYVVVGFERDELVAGLEKAIPAGANLHLVENPDWRLSNGVSLLKANGAIHGRFFLSMSDHLFQPQMVETLGAGALEEDSLYLAIDRKLDTIFDMDDATKVKIQDDRIVEIDKQLEVFDAVDTGLFICPPAIFEHLEQARQSQAGDCSLSDGVRSLGKSGKARIVDVGPAFWQDVDTQDMLDHAHKFLKEHLE